MRCRGSSSAFPPPYIIQVVPTSDDRVGDRHRDFVIFHKLHADCPGRDHVLELCTLHWCPPKKDHKQCLLAFHFFWTAKMSSGCQRRGSGDRGLCLMSVHGLKLLLSPHCGLGRCCARLSCASRSQRTGMTLRWTMTRTIGSSIFYLSPARAMDQS